MSYEFQVDVTPSGSMEYHDSRAPQRRATHRSPRSRSWLPLLALDVGLDYSGEEGKMMQCAARGERGRPLETMREEFRQAFDVAGQMINLDIDSCP